MSITWTVVILVALVVYVLLDLRRCKRRVKQLETKLAEPATLPREVHSRFHAVGVRIQHLEAAERQRTITDILR